MKTLHLAIIIFSFVLVQILSQTAFAQKTAHEILQERDDMPMTKLVHGNAILIVNQTTNKLVYKSGENITIIPELINIGNQNVTIGYGPPLFDSEVIGQHGKKVWPALPWGHILFEHGMTLEPNMSYTGDTADYKIDKKFFVLDTPGNYTIISVASFTIYEKMMKPYDAYLWSKPLQITVVPEFPFAEIVLLLSIASMIVLYRIKLRK